VNTTPHESHRQTGRAGVSAPIRDRSVRDGRATVIDDIPADLAIVNASGFTADLALLDRNIFEAGCLPADATVTHTFVSGALVWSS
jgi:hypothetical protein